MAKEVDNEVDAGVGVKACQGSKAFEFYTLHLVRQMEIICFYIDVVSFENFVKSMPPSLSELKVIPSFCFAFKIPDDVTAMNRYV